MGQAGILFTKEGGKGFCSFKELGGGDGIVVFGVDGDIDEAFVEGIEPCASGRE